MRRAIRFALVVLVILGTAVGGVAYLSSPVSGTNARRTAPRVSPPNRAPRPAQSLPDDGRIPLYSDGFIEDSGYELSLRFTGPAEDRSSLAQVREATRGRARRGLAELRQRIDVLSPHDSGRPPLEMMAALLHMYDGEFDEAIGRLTAAAADPNLPRSLHANLIALRGVASLRRGEIENCVACVGPSSCIFPIAPEAVHQAPEGSQGAFRDFLAYLRERPDDLGVRWLLNIAAMTLGEYPDKVPKEYLISLDAIRSQHNPGRFSNVATLVGLNRRGQNMVGGSIFDDFTGDGLPDIFVNTVDIDLGASLFVNRGDGTFQHRCEQAGLADQTFSLNARQADFDNDGRLDVLMVRGAWENPCPLSLLRNTGEGFEDVTVASGLGLPIASQSVAWGDYDNDGLIDLYIAGETRGGRYDEMNRCRLYHNEGAGKFVDVAAKAGVENRHWTKGVTWGDYDDDGLIDLYVSNMDHRNRLYHNNGDGTFTDVAERLGVTEPLISFSCWFWDYDNDGRLDIFVAGYRASLNDYVRDVLGQPSKAERPRLFRNLGPEGFRDVTKEVGLDRVFMTMGSNFADIDNDGCLDIYFGTGFTSYSSLVPNVMLKSVGGARFEDVTVATGTGHLQKAHGVSFADWDGDGDVDLFFQVGGNVPGDRGHNALFQNPGHGRHWLALKLVGTRSNRAAIGARVRVDYRGADGSPRSVYRMVGSGSSYGGNSLVVHLGLDQATKADTVTVMWPIGKGASQTFRDIEVDQTIEITEGESAYRRLPARRFSVPNAGSVVPTFPSRSASAR